MTSIFLQTCENKAGPMNAAEILDHLIRFATSHPKPFLFAQLVALGYLMLFIRARHDSLKTLPNKAYAYIIVTVVGMMLWDLQEFLLNKHDFRSLILNLALRCCVWVASFCSVLRQGSVF
jgi:hypothetical protein